MYAKHVENAQLFDAAGYDEYKKNIWNPIYKQGLYFSALDELGHEVSLYMGFRESEGSELKWFRAPHALYDGFSAMKDLGKKLGLNFSFPGFRHRPCQNPIRAIIKALFSSPKVDHHFLNQNQNVEGTDFNYLDLSFDTLSTKYTNTALLAKVCCQVLMKELSSNESSRWMVPVRLNDGPGLQASYLGLQVDSSDTTEDVHKKLVGKLKGEEHWGFYFLGKLGLKLGKKVILALTKKSILNQKTLWMGSISNLGPLACDKDIRDVVMPASVRWHRPLGVILYEFNNKQVITISFHKSLSEVPVERIKQEITRIYKSYL